MVAREAERSVRVADRRGHVHRPPSRLQTGVQPGPQRPPRALESADTAGAPAVRVHRGSPRRPCREDPGSCSFRRCPGGEKDERVVGRSLRAAGQVPPRVTSRLTETDAGVCPPEAPRTCPCGPAWCANGHEAPAALTELSTLRRLPDLQVRLGGELTSSTSLQGHLQKQN